MKTSGGTVFITGSRDSLEYINHRGAETPWRSHHWWVVLDTGELLFATVPDSSINSWESWFIFNLWKINTNQHYESVSLNVRNCKHNTRTHDITWERAYNNYCTYLNSHLLGAPHEYVLHGLVPGLNWVLSGLSLSACILLPCPTQYLAVYFSGSGFTPNAFLLSGWLLTNLQVNNITTLHDICAHMYIHPIGITILLSFLHIFHSSWQAGWTRLFPSDTVITNV
jgi:hypothetical protein